MEDETNNLNSPVNSPIGNSPTPNISPEEVSIPQKKFNWLLYIVLPLAVLVTIIFLGFLLVSTTLFQDSKLGEDNNGLSENSANEICDENSSELCGDKSSNTDNHGGTSETDIQNDENSSSDSNNGENKENSEDSFFFSPVKTISIFGREVNEGEVVPNSYNDSIFFIFYSCESQGESCNDKPTLCTLACSENEGKWIVEEIGLLGGDIIQCKCDYI